MAKFFSDRDVRRISRSVRATEAAAAPAHSSPQMYRDAVEWGLFRLVDPLVENHRALAHRLRYDKDADTWTADEEDFLVKGWKCDGKAWDSGADAWCKIEAGRWFWLIPEDCGRALTETDEETASGQEDDYDEAGLE